MCTEKAVQDQQTFDGEPSLRGGLCEDEHCQGTAHRWAGFPGMGNSGEKGRDTGDTEEAGKQDG